MATAFPVPTVPNVAMPLPRLRSSAVRTTKPSSDALFEDFWTAHQRWWYCIKPERLEALGKSTGLPESQISKSARWMLIETCRNISSTFNMTACTWSLTARWDESNNLKRLLSTATFTSIESGALPVLEPFSDAAFACKVTLEMLRSVPDTEPTLCLRCGRRTLHPPGMLAIALLHGCR